MTGDARTASPAPAADPVAPSSAAVLDGIDDGLAVLTDDGVVRWANAAFRGMVAGSRETLAGVPLDSLVTLVPPPGVPGAPLPDDAISWEGRAVPPHGAASDAGRGYPASLRRLAPGAADPDLLLTLRSDTGHGECRAEVRRAEGAGRLARAAVHELNNVLAAITTFTELLLATRSEAGPDDRDREDLEEIRSAARRGAEVTRAVAAFRAEGPLPPEAVDLGAVLQAHRGLVRRLLPADVDLGWDLPPSGPRVRIDPRALDRLVVNLALDLGEARPGGDLRLGTALIPGDVRGSHDDDASPSTSWVALEIEGAGVGSALPAVRASARLAGVSVEGGPDTLRILLPAADPAPSTPVLDAGSGPSGPATPTVLLVESDSALRAGVRRVLTDHGFGVLDAPDGAEALALVADGGLRPDVVLVEPVAPEPSGAAFERALRASGVDAPVVFVSGRGDHPRVVALRRAGIPVLDKPVPTSRLLRTLREAVDAGRSGS